VIRTFAVLAVVLAAVGGLWALTVAQQGVTCEACMEVGGRSACRTVSAPSREEAERHAISTACAIVTSGVTADLACQRTPPRTLRCE